jgi:regulator of replication initiation timing
LQQPQNPNSNIEKIDHILASSLIHNITKPVDAITMASLAPIFNTKNDSENKLSEGELVAANSKLRQQVTTLEAENAKLKSENAQLKKRKASDSTGAAASASSGPPATKKPKTPAQRTKLFEKWTKGAIRESSKHKIINGGYVAILTQ